MLRITFCYALSLFLCNFASLSYTISLPLPLSLSIYLCVWCVFLDGFGQSADIVSKQDITASEYAYNVIRATESEYECALCSYTPPPMYME